MGGKGRTASSAALSRRQALLASAATGLAARLAVGAGLLSAAFAEAAAAVPGKMRISGPIPTTATSKPFGTAAVEGTPAYDLLEEFDYVEEEYFASGSCNVYGPGVVLDTIKTGVDFEGVGALSKVVRSGVLYRTRLLVVRPRDLARFSGNVHAIPFHNLGARSSVERHVLRSGDAWIGIEASNGTKFGPKETLSGGVAHLLKTDPDRYGTLSLPGGEPGDWPDLTPGNLGHTSAELNFAVQNNYPMSVFLQEIHRGYAQGPDLLSQLARLLKEGGAGSPLAGAKVRRTFSYGASGGTTLLMPYIQYHHDRAMLPDGRPPFDGYLVMVGQQPSNRPKGAVMVFLDSEAEALRHPLPLPENTDNPRFRFYEIPGTGHSISAPVNAASATQRSVDHTGIEEVLPDGIAGLTARGGPTAFEPYDKINAPIIWGIWSNMYAWLEHGRPMPIAPPIERDPAAPDRIARDEHGNAKGGLRTPWVDVPGARYVPRISPENPLRAGMQRFSDAKIRELYGSREAYLERCRARVDKMAADGWIQTVDAALMKRSCN
jgi:hypothetical protein